MGTWGPALFDDDDAVDLRDGYRVYLADAQSDGGATELAARDYGAHLDRPGETTAFWLALAAIQWRMGRLDPRVRDAAFTIIDDRLDLAKWEGSPAAGKRAAVLARLRKQLGGPMPAAKGLPKPLPTQLPGLAFGEVIGFRAANGRYVLLHVLGYHGWSTLSVRAPQVTVLNWFAAATPDEADIARLTYINHDGLLIGGHHIVCLAMPRSKALQLAQFDRPGWMKPVTRGEASSAVCGLSGHEGGTLDRTLARVLWPYWEDPTRPVHVPKDFPGLDAAEAGSALRAWRARLFGTPEGPAPVVRPGPAP